MLPLSTNTNGYWHILSALMTGEPNVSRNLFCLSVKIKAASFENEGILQAHAVCKVEEKWPSGMALAMILHDVVVWLTGVSQSFLDSRYTVWLTGVSHLFFVLCCHCSSLRSYGNSQLMAYMT